MKVIEWIRLVGLGVLFYGPLLLASWWLRDMTGSGIPFAPHREKIVVTNTAMRYCHLNNTNIISTVGYLRNDSPYSWEGLQLEVQYFDRSNRLIDTKTETLSFQELPAGVTEAFRIRTVAAGDESGYASHKVFVRSAKDARRLLNGGD